MSDRGELSEGTRRLIDERVRSIEALEALMALHAERTRALSPAELATRSRLPPQTVGSAIEELVAQRLARFDARASTVRYAPESEELDARVAQLAADYESHRVELLVLISSNALNRVRRGALHTFSEAFRLRGSKKDG